MFKKTITYTDYNGEERTEDFYFNLSKSEILEMNLLTEGGLEEHIKRIVQAKDAPRIVELFKDLIHKSYGVKSLDGKRFVKNQEVLDEFRQTEAYSELFFELATDAEAGAAFINGITSSIHSSVPKD